MLRHTLATLAYRAGKVLRDAPSGFTDFRASQDTRSAGQILAHMGDLMDWVLRMAQGEVRWTTATPLAWDAEIRRFFTSLGALDAYLASGATIAWDSGRLYQGGIADALTHTGQLAMLRRLSGFKMKGENYARADIAIGRVGIDQTPPDPRYEFD